MSNNEGWIAIALVARPHALRGAVLLKALTRTPDELLDAPVEAVYFRHRGNIQGPFRIEEMAMHKGMPYVFFEGIEDRTTAEQYIGHEVVIPAAERWELEEGRFYYDDLQGLAAEEEGTGRPLGPVLRVEDGAAHDYLILNHPQREGRPLMIPMTPQFVPHVDLEQGRIRVIIPEGLLDI